ncbi:PREDICTED: zinc finger CCHC domain-containing protein 8 homolog [Bactrocera latifrons]|uniref:Zinc finger CCHC domain-containing protein 8 n=1 Tax=Bactrocera latifrons TaxID=174628 RepID=A0A0K8UW69_BACLA|nr:PREDICTED: zinc finger CCHC domain-containing protein 8 homolog [Bactrocera latifrons]
MDKNADIIKLDSDNENLEDRIRDTTTVDLTSDTSMNETPEKKLPVANTVKEAIVCVEFEEGEVEEAQEAAEICQIISSKQTLAFEIKFSNESVFKEYGHKVLDSLDKAFNMSVDNPIFAFKILNSENTTVSSINAYIEKESAANHSNMELSDCEEAVSVTGVASERLMSDNEDDSPDLDLASLFTIDTSGSKKLDTQCVPSYKRSIKDVLNEESSARKRQKLEEEENECQRVRTTVACFNCGVNGHSLRECPKPRNNARINRAKLARKQERYHIDIEQRFGHLRPGKISDKLQTALGLKRGELPFFFYRMRKLGYPPGWLEEAKVVHSGISLINSDGNAVLASEDENSQESDENKYDISKIVDFPGFNVDPGPNFYDDYKHHNVPPLSRHQRKEEFIKKLGSNVVKGYKHKRLKSLPQTTNVAETKTSILDNADMEIEDDVAVDENVVFTRPPPPPEPANDIKPPPPPTSPDDATTSATNEESSSVTNERTCSPTLDYLEERKQKLLAELKSGLCDIDSLSSSSATEESLVLETSNSEAKTSGISKPTNMNEIHTVEPTTPTALDIIKESHMGTPVLHFSPYEKLPAGDNFKVGVSDVINFENLPDSTGKYEQMKEVIKKVRNIVTKLHNDDDD